MPTRTRVADISELAPGRCIAVSIGATKIAMFNLSDGFYAIDDTCPHRGGPLSEGEVDGHTVACPWHAATFDLKSGAVTGPPATVGVKSYRVSVEGGEVFVETP
ncbi:MAG: non-heme iron oxygenase ferredoxin subunit [Phycisphaerae bacterium]